MMENKIKYIVLRYLYLKENHRDTPSWLSKQVKGIWLMATDRTGGTYLLKEGLQEERDYITELLAGLDG